jgi:protein-S-isoprenylcysteine O-methyltransferase Ste14
MLGIFISCGSLIIAVNGIILFIYYLISAFIEERAILIKFPDYIKYKSKTGMFIPSIIKGMIQ